MTLTGRVARDYTHCALTFDGNYVAVQEQLATLDGQRVRVTVESVTGEYDAPLKPWPTIPGVVYLPDDGPTPAEVGAAGPQELAYEHLHEKGYGHGV